MAERWFFALWPEARMRASMSANLAGLVSPGARAAHPADLHLTLVFLGELGPDALACAERVADGIRAQPFDLCLDQVGRFARSRVQWCGPARTPPGLERLVADLESGLGDCAIPLERRAFRPHVTLARKVGSCRTGLMDVSLSWRVTDFVLAGGRGGRIPRYAVRRRWSLGRGDGVLAM